MLRKNKGSILVVTVFVFFLVNIIAIHCSALILSNTKYIKYDYEEIYLKEQCLSKIELIYSNILKEVDYALKEKQDFEQFEKYISSSEFLNKIKQVQEDDLNNTTCEIKKVNSNNENKIYYKITSKSTDNKFTKYMVASIEIENPFKKEENIKEIENLESDTEEILQNTSTEQKGTNKNSETKKSSDLVVMFDCKEV